MRKSKNILWVLALLIMIVAIPVWADPVVYNQGSSSAPSGAAGGDLSGTYPNPTVAKINGGSVPTSKAIVGTDSNGKIVDATSASLTNNTSGTAAGLSATLAASSGGTGVANNAASTITISGNYGTTFTVSNTTSLTLPTTGTVATLAGSETLTNKTLTAPVITTNEVDGHTNGTTLTAAQMSRSTIYNVGQGSNAVTLNLPAAAAGYSAIFVCGEAQTSKRWRFRAASNDKIYLIGTDGSITAGADNGYVGITSPVVGAFAQIQSFKTGSSTYDWIVSFVGTWTAE